MLCKTCKRTEYVPLEKRDTVTLDEVIRMAQKGRLRVWIDGRIHYVEGE
jgi:hypothetical protein